MKVRNEMSNKLKAIGFSTKIHKLPLEIVNACRSDCSIKSPKINASSIGAAGNLKYAMK